MTEEEINNGLPIIPHAAIGEIECPGCLIVALKDRTCEVLCNECGRLVATALPVQLLGSFFENLLKDGS